MIEVQLRPDPSKAYSFTPDARVAKWAAQVSPQGPGWSFKLLVLGPDMIPVVATPEEAAARPELAVLSVMAHAGRMPSARAVARATAATQADVNLPCGELYFDAILASLSAAARKAFEAMNMKNYEFFGSFRPAGSRWLRRFVTRLLVARIWPRWTDGFSARSLPPGRMMSFGTIRSVFCGCPLQNNKALTPARRPLRSLRCRTFCLT